MSGEVEVELLCPAGGPGRDLLGKLVVHPDTPTQAQPLVELSCNDCTRAARRRGALVARVLHRFDLTGRVTATEHVPGRARVSTT